MGELVSSRICATKTMVCCLKLNSSLKVASKNGQWPLCNQGYFPQFYLPSLSIVQPSLRYFVVHDDNQLIPFTLYFQCGMLSSGGGLHWGGVLCCSKYFTYDQEYIRKRKESVVLCNAMCKHPSKSAVVKLTISTSVSIIN